MSNAFNDDFSSIGPNLANDIPLSNPGFKATENKLIKSKEAGLDKLSSRLIRECTDLISPYISTIFNCCLTTGIFPDDWKWPKLRPYLSKAIEVIQINNYRRISVISATAKV